VKGGLASRVQPTLDASDRGDVPAGVEGCGGIGSTTGCDGDPVLAALAEPTAVVIAAKAIAANSAQ
jgi:hypothetical protein